MELYCTVYLVGLACLFYPSLGQQNNGFDHGTNLNNQLNDRPDNMHDDESPVMIEPNTGDIPNMQTDGGSSDMESVCHLHPQDENLVNEVAKLIQDDVKLIQFTFTFPEYETNPLTENSEGNYKSDVWQRVFDEHGRNLLALKFNYDVLSLSLLTFGVEKMDVAVIDAPPRCFGMISPTSRIRAVKELLLANLHIDYLPMHPGGEYPINKGDQACHYIIKNETDDGVAGFHYECCGRDVCSDKHEQKWLQFLMILIALLKLVVIMCGPLILLHWSFYDSLRVTDYVVMLKQPTKKTMLVKKVRMAEESPADREKKDMKQLQKFRQLLKTIPAEKLLHVVFNKLHIMVDQRHLMTQRAIPVGFFRFLYESIFCCGFTMWEPFHSCCAESLVGSWNQRFLWFNLKKKGDDCNNSCRKFISWKHVLRICGGICIAALLLLPYYGRVIVYYAYEHDELEDRRNAVKELGLKWPFQFSLIHFLDPSHGALISMYAVSGSSFVLLALLRACSVHTFDQIVLQAFQDLRQVRRLECVRMILAHVLLPFEKFGACGLVVAVFYWPIMIPISVLVGIIYCIPTTYLMCRFLIHRRPDFLRQWPVPTHRKRQDYPDGIRTLSDGVSSFESCFMLDNIQHDNDEERLISPAKTSKTVVKRKKFQCITRQELGVCMLKLVMGLLSIALLCSIILMLTESFGFIVEMFVFTLMGGLVNAGSATQYVLLAFWFLLYANVCYKRVYDRYLRLSEQIFKLTQEHNEDEIKKATYLRHNKHKNTAYKYFSEDDLQQMEQEELTNQYEDRDPGSTVVPIYQPKSHENIERKGSKLYWRINDLVMFVDQHDEARIPIDLFKRICEVEAPGCPGPQYKSYVKATKHLFYMILFLLFVLGIVMSFSATYDISNTNQLLLILSAGFLPFIIRYMFLAKGTGNKSDLKDYTYGGKIQEIIRAFSQPWPVFDFSFRLATLEEMDLPHNMEMANGFTSLESNNRTDTLVKFRQQPESLPLPDPDSVDLYICIRDDGESDRENQHPGGEPSGGSRLSLNSLLHRTSPANADDEQTLLANTAATRNIDNAATLPKRLNDSHTNDNEDDRVSVSSISSQNSQRSSARPVELVVDAARGNVCVRGADKNTKPENGEPVWKKQLSLNSLNESESKL